MSGLITCPVPLLHLTHPLQPVPDKHICADDAAHLTFDVSVFILGYCLPALLLFFLSFGLVIRYCTGSKKPFESLEAVVAYLVARQKSQLFAQ